MIPIIDNLNLNPNFCYLNRPIHHSLSYYNHRLRAHLFRKDIHTTNDHAIKFVYDVQLRLNASGLISFM